DRKSTRLNSSHDQISYAVFCMKKKTPFGVGAAVAHTIGQNGFGVLAGLGKLVATLYGAQALFVVLVLVPVLMIARVPVARFFQTVREPALFFFFMAPPPPGSPLFPYTTLFR